MELLIGVQALYISTFLIFKKRCKKVYVGVLELHVHYTRAGHTFFFTFLLD